MQLSESWLGTDSISLLSCDSECGGHAGNDDFHQGLDPPLNLQTLQVLLGFLSPAKGLLEMDERQPRIPRAFSPKGVP